MKFFISFLFVAFSFFAQQAQDYFPNDFSYVWYFQNNTLDSNNVPIESSTFWTKDSLATEITYHDKNAKVILNATGTESTIAAIPYTDTSFVALENTNAGFYVDLTSLIDTSVFPDENFYNTLKSLSGWYLLYHFASAPYLQYEILSVDTTIEIDSVSYPLRFLIKGERQPDENLDTEIGSFNCKKFNIISSVNFVQHSPFGDIIIPLVTKDNYVWIAPSHWVVKEFSPSHEVDFSQFGGPKFWIPGFQKIIKSYPSAVEDEFNLTNFELKQNYPNPFNPTTTIEYSIPNVGTKNFSSLQNVELKIYDVLGREVATLVNEKQSPGNYSVKFDASKLNSGVYFYTLRVGKFASTKKMILLK